MESLPFVHANLSIDVTSSKGRLVSAAKFIKHGEVVMVDTPYTLVPAMMVDDPPFLLCSRHGCNRRIPSKVASQTSRVGCPDHCTAEVVWCSEECRSRDTIRHDMECLWLRQTSTEIRDSHGDSDFGLLWMIARILIVKHLDEKAATQTNGRHSDTADRHASSNGKVSSSHFGRRGWDAVWNLEGEPDSFPADQVSKWRAMTAKYLVGDTLRFKYLVDDIVKLICKVETNSFGLYPGITGQFPVVSSAGRGDYYGGGIYPTAAMFNHACCPNVGTRSCCSQQDLCDCLLYSPPWQLTLFPGRSPMRSTGSGAGYSGPAGTSSPERSAASAISTWRSSRVQRPARRLSGRAGISPAHASDARRTLIFPTF